MKRNNSNARVLYGLAIILLITAITPSRALLSDKVSVEDVIAKHLESIGAAETRASIKNRVFSGTVLAAYRAPRTANFNGDAVMASEGNKEFIGMRFENSPLGQERFAFDGKDVTIGYSNPGDRSNLADFLLTHKDAIKTGLMGGVLSSAWPLLGPANPKMKISYVGTTKINNTPAIEISYAPKSGSDLEMHMYFEQETYRHIRTEYARLITAGIGGGIDQSGQQRSTRYKMTEDFSDFKKEGGLMLPHSYKINLVLDGRNGTFTADWEMKFTQFDFNQQIPPTTFKVQ